MKRKTKYPPIDEVENLRWTDNHTQVHSIGYGFCEAQNSCDDCDIRIRLLCKARKLIDEIRVGIIKRHYGIKKGW